MVVLAELDVGGIFGGAEDDCDVIADAIHQAGAALGELFPGKRVGEEGRLGEGRLYQGRND